MDLVFCGTPQFAVPTLRALLDAGFPVRLVVTQPDRPSGRGQELAAPPVKQAALAAGLPVVQPEKIKDNPEFRAQLQAIAPRAIVVVGYGRLIPKWMLDLPPLGNLNLHASLLPKYRGAAPIQWAIACGERVTGVSTMRLDEGLDTGGVLMQEPMPIAADDTAITLAPRLAARGALLMVQTLRGLEAGTLRPTPQDDSQASLAPILKKEDGLVDFTRAAAEICNRLRGFQPWPGAYTSLRGRTLLLHAAKPATDVPHMPPGRLLPTADRLYVACGHGTVLELLELQLEGKKRMPARDFLHGYQPKLGEVLGS